MIDKACSSGYAAPFLATCPDLDAASPGMPQGAPLAAARPVGMATMIRSAPGRRMQGSLTPRQKLELRWFARCAFNTVRTQYRGGDKSSNKVRMPRHCLDVRGLNDVTRWQRCASLHFAMHQDNASLDELRSARVGNCTEMARAAAQEARKLGLQASVWGFFFERRAVPHEIAIVRLPQQQPAAATRLEDTYQETFDEREDFWVIDPWAGICCQGADYDLTFLAKMHKWAELNKHIHVGGQWLRADDPDWQGAIVASPRVMLREESLQAGALRA